MKGNNKDNDNDISKIHVYEYTVKNNKDPIDRIIEAKRNVALGMNNANSYKEYIRALNMI